MCTHARARAHTHTHTHTPQKEPQQCQPSQRIIIILSSYLTWPLCVDVIRSACVWSKYITDSLSVFKTTVYCLCHQTFYTVLQTNTHANARIVHSTCKKALVLPDTLAQPQTYWCVTSSSLLYIWCLNTFKQGLKMYLLTVWVLWPVASNCISEVLISILQQQ
jgi:hypothetical protein